MKQIVIILSTVLLLLTVGCKQSADASGAAGAAAEASVVAGAENAAQEPVRDPARDAALLENARLLGGVTQEHALVVLRHLDDRQTAQGGGADWLERLANEARKVLFLREIPFEAGVLIAAREPGDEETDAELYYVADGRVASRTWGADSWGLDVARFLGHTIVFGANFSYETDATDIVASFFDGTEVAQPLAVSAEDPSGAEGYILVADGWKNLRALTIRNNGAPVADHEELLYALGCANYAWAGTPMNVFYVTHLCTMRPEPPELAPLVSLDGAFLGGYDWEAQRYEKNGADWYAPDAWRTNNGLYCGTTVHGGDTLTFKLLPENATRVYLALPSRDDATDAGAQRAIVELTLANNAVTLPELSGETEVRLVVETPDTANVFTLAVE